MNADPSHERPKRPLFPLNQLLITPGAIEVLTNGDITVAIRRHFTGDWGDVDEEDWQANDHALQNGLRLLSAYKTDKGVRFWIITEADRSATTLLLPDEY